MVERFNFSNNSIEVLDYKTNLVWLTNLEYYYSIREAINYSKKLSIESESNWRLPFYNEIENALLNKDLCSILFPISGYDRPFWCANLINNTQFSIVDTLSIDGVVSIGQSYYQTVDNLPVPLAHILLVKHVDV